MSEQVQRQELHRKIWKIADEVRGAVDGWDFKQYILGILFYRFISENFKTYIEGGDESINYEEISEDLITPEVRDDAIKTKGYFIMPSQLFSSVVKTARQNERLNTDLKDIFDDIESSAIGYASEHDIKGLFDDVDTRSNKLGSTVPERNQRLALILEGIASLDFGNFEDNHIDLFGDAYEYLISNYASNAGKSGGEFLQAKKQFNEHIIEDGFYGQEINMTTYNLARMNMFLHNINYDKFSIERGNTLLDPKHVNDKPFDAIVSNPPYSIKWIGSDDPTLINDDRFAPAGVLAPKSKADFAFIMHSLSYLSNKGRAAIVTFPGIFYRGGAEQKIRQYLVDNNFVEAVIQLPDNLFFGTSIATCILILAKNKPTTDILFVDASKQFKKETNNNVLEKKNIKKILDSVEKKENEDYFSCMVAQEKVAEADYNLSVSTYVEKEDTREKIDIDVLNKEIAESVTKIDHLRAEIDKIVEELSHGK